MAAWIPFLMQTMRIICWNLIFPHPLSDY